MKKKLIIILVCIGAFSGSAILVLAGNNMKWMDNSEFRENIENSKEVDRTSSTFSSWIENPVLNIYRREYLMPNFEVNNEDTNESWKSRTNQELIAQMDFYSDESIQRFLDKKHPLKDKYEAKDIVPIVSDFTTNDSRRFYLREEAAIAFADMARGFSNAFGFKSCLSINSARRSQAYQRRLSAKCSTGRCADPWTSEHEAWLAVDLGVNWWNIKTWSWKYYQRLLDNAHLYGFHNSYQNGIQTEGIIVEPRHWRYLGVELATILHEEWKTFTQYFYDNIENSSEF